MSEERERDRLRVRVLLLSLTSSDPTAERFACSSDSGAKRTDTRFHRHAALIYAVYWSVAGNAIPTCHPSCGPCLHSGLGGQALHFQCSYPRNCLCVVLSLEPALFRDRVPRVCASFIVLHIASVRLLRVNVAHCAQVNSTRLLHCCCS